MAQWKIAVVGWLSNLLLFCLVFGMSATVDIACLQAQLKNRKAIVTGIALQFLVMPLLGFLVAHLFQLEQAVAITLLVVTSSPGGSFSNWWCSLFNADLALSVTMTAISTLLSVVMLPFNLIVYMKLAHFNHQQNYEYDSEVLAVVSVHWRSLVVALVIVIGGILSGLWASKTFHSHRFNLNANRLGNFCAVWLIVISAVMANSHRDSLLWDRDWRFYVGVATPPVLGLLLANVLTTALRLLKPERVAVSIECCLQNVGIATSIALGMFHGNDLAQAMGVPFYYGMVAAILVFLYCIAAWKAGWTKAPASVSLWKAVCTSYEILSVEEVERFDAASATVPAATTPPVPVSMHYEEEDSFHYVQHSDIIPHEGFCGGTHACGDLNATSATITKTKSWDKANQRREPTYGSDLKEPSYVMVD